MQVRAPFTQLIGEALAAIWTDGAGHMGLDPDAPAWLWSLIGGEQAPDTPMLQLLQRALIHIALVGEITNPALAEEDALAFGAEQVDEAAEDRVMWLAASPLARMEWVDRACARRELAPWLPLAERLGAGQAEEAAQVMRQVRERASDPA